MLAAACYKSALAALKTAGGPKATASGALVLVYPPPRNSGSGGGGGGGELRLVHRLVGFTTVLLPVSVEIPAAVFPLLLTATDYCARMIWWQTKRWLKAGDSAVRRPRSEDRGRGVRTGAGWPSGTVLSFLAPSLLPLISVALLLVQPYS